MHANNVVNIFSDKEKASDKEQTYIFVRENASKQPKP
jgi:ribosomal protein S24E